MFDLMAFPIVIGEIGKVVGAQTVHTLVIGQFADQDQTLRCYSHGITP